MNASSERALTLSACAKVNLCLSVGYPPRGGYHPVRSVFQELSLHDVMRFAVVEGFDAKSPQTVAGTHIDLRCDVEGVSTADNLIFRALDEAEAAFALPAIAPEETLVIDVEKHIPVGGGLGGGSSNAAAMLRAYAWLAGVDVQDPLLHDVARRLGADVAFFLHGGTALMGERGDVLERELPAMRAPIVLMGSARGNSTAEVYRMFDENPQPILDVDALAAALEEVPQDIDCIAALCGNNLGFAACEADPLIQQRIGAALEQPGVLNALVSGSGATSFAICENEAAAERLAQAIAPLCGWVSVCCV